MDFVTPEGVGEEDLLYLIQDWLQTHPAEYIGADVNGDAVVNLMDFALFAKYRPVGE